MIDRLKRYPAMKDSGIEWLGRVPAHWNIQKIKTLFCEKDQRGGGGRGVLLSLTRTHGIVPHAKVSKRMSSASDLARYKVCVPGDLVMNRMQAWSGMFSTSSFDGLVSPDYSVFAPVSGDDICVIFFEYLFKAPILVDQFAKRSKGIGSGFNRLYTADFGAVYVTVPPTQEQTTIARFLDYVDRRIQRYIRANEKLVALLEEYKQAIIHQAVKGRIDVRTGQPYPAYKDSDVEWLGQVPEHWEVRRLKNVAEMRISNVDKHTRDGEYPIRLCNYVDVYKNDHISPSMLFMRGTATADEIARFRLTPGDVLITKDSEAWDDIGVPALVVESADDLVSGYHLALLRPLGTRLNGGYLLRALQSRSIGCQFHVQANGVTRYGLSHTAIKSVWLPLPPLPEQTAIVRYLDKATANADSAIDRAYDQIELFREYRTRLTADVVTGKLDVRDAAAGLPQVDPLARGDVDDPLDPEVDSALEDLESRTEVII